jgi:hypothetical protein
MATDGGNMMSVVKEKQPIDVMAAYPQAAEIRDERVRAAICLPDAIAFRRNDTLPDPKTCADG